MLGDCLASACDLVDEMIVVDTGSADATVAVARNAGARVEHFSWCDDFAAARNASIDHATGDWVLILDADERLGPGAAQRLRAAVRDAPSFVCGMVRIHDAKHRDASPTDVVSGAERIGEPMYVPRLLRRTDDLAFEGIVHESVRAWLVRHQNRMHDTGADVVHLGVVPDTRMSRGKRARNVTLLEKRLAEEPQDFTIHGYLAHEHLGAEDDEAAWQVVEAGWKIFRSDAPKELRSVLRLAAARALLQFRRGDPEGALATARQSAAYEGRHPDLAFFSGRAHEMLAMRADGPAREEALEAARAAYQDALSQKTRVVAQRYVSGSSGWAAAARLGNVELFLGAPRAALEHYDAALAERDALEAQLGRAEALALLTQGAEAERVVAGAIESDPSLPDGHLVRALIASVRGDLTPFSAALAQARERSEHGYLEPRRNLLHGELFCELLAYLGQPAPGRGAIGTATALMAGGEPERIHLDDHGRASLRRFIRNLLEHGRAADAEKLLTESARHALPGIVALVEVVAESLGMSVEER